MQNQFRAGIPGSAGGNMGQREELKTQFMTREGLYKLMTLSEYSRPNRYVGCFYTVILSLGRRRSVTVLF